jgi:large subunit ribosomal protein L25
MEEELVMAEYELLVEPRELTGKKARRLRVDGYVPAVVYGGGAEAQSVSVDSRNLERVVQEAGITSLIALQIGKNGPVERALVRDIQYDVVRRTIQHIDFMRVRVGEKLTTDVGVVLVGDQPADGMVVQDRNSVEIECLPSDLIQSIEVSIDLLESIGSTITVKDLLVADSVRILTDEDEVIAHIEALRELEEEEVTPEPFEVGEVTIVSDREEPDLDWE